MFELFILLTIISLVIFISFLSVEMIKEISYRFHLSQSFLGFSLLALATSFPEIINAITAGVKLRLNSNEISFAKDSFYNVIGANMIQNVFICLIILSFGIYVFFNKQQTPSFWIFVSSVLFKKKLLWYLIVFETIMMLLMMQFKDFFKIFNIQGINIIWFLTIIIWTSYLYYFFINNKDEKEETNEKITSIKLKKNIFSNINNKAFCLIAIFIWITFALLSFFNFYLISSISKKNSISGHLALGLLLSLITSLPEFSSFYFFFRDKNYSSATAGLMGSSLLNLCLPFITNVISGQWLFSMNSFENYKTSMSYWLLSDIFINICIFISIIFFFKKYYSNLFFSTLSIGVYLSILILL